MARLSVERIVIIGAGPAGISAAIQLRRVGLAPVLLEKNEVGGLLRNAHRVENYPGFPDGIAGPDLVARFKAHLEAWKIKVRKAEAIRLSALPEKRLSVETEETVFRPEIVIVASGTRPEAIDLPGSEGLRGRRIFYEPVEMPLERLSGKRVIVAGGGDAALDYALNLRAKGAHVSILTRSKPCGLALLQRRIEDGHIEVKAQVALLSAQKRESGLRLKIRQGERMRTLAADYLLLACGRTPARSFFDGVLENLIPPETIETGIPGLFLAGDVIRGRYRQTGIAVGDGLLAAMKAEEYLRRGREANGKGRR